MLYVRADTVYAGVAEDVVRVVLSIADKLLPEIDDAGEAQNMDVDTVIARHIPLLLQNMFSLLSAQQRKPVTSDKKDKRKPVVTGRLSLSILARIS